MNNYFKDRMDEIQLRTEQMNERKMYESEIDSLEEKLKSLESNYQRLQITFKSNLEQSAMTRVGLTVAKEAYEFAEAMLKEKQSLLVDERRKMDDLHWQVWEEQIKTCDEMGKCLEENDSVSFLNEYPRVLKTQKHAFLAVAESDRDIKKLVDEHPEIKQLRAEITALETEIKKTENSCSSNELQKVLNEIKELNGNDDDHNANETQRLIEALEDSHRERMSLEAKITEIENRKIGVPSMEEKLKISQKDSKEFSRVKTEPHYYTSGVSGASNDEKQFENKLETREDNEFQIIKERDNKLKAKKWYEEYIRDIASTNEENDSKRLCILDVEAVTSQSDFLNVSKQGNPRVIIPHDNSSKENKEDVENSNPVAFGVAKKKFYPKIASKRQISAIKSRFFDKNSASMFCTTLKSEGNLIPKNQVVDAKVPSQGTPKANRKFEPLMATPSTFFKSAAETTFDNNFVQSVYDEKPSTSAQGTSKVKKTVKFTPKLPSKVGKKPSAYRQTKLDDFHNFMLANNK